MSLTIPRITILEHIADVKSVFLRVLECYSGILILTTNRVGDFDEAVKSRVHCALYYPPLDRRNTKKIWKMNLDLLQRQNESPDCNMPVRFDRKEILEFADSHWKDGSRWNGRQIKNAFQTAVALADWDSLRGSAGATLGSSSRSWNAGILKLFPWPAPTSTRILAKSGETTRLGRG